MQTATTAAPVPLLRRGALEPASDAVTAERRELKFAFPATSVDALRDVLRVNARCVHFGDGSPSQVSSVYFDDHRLSSYSESVAGVARRVKLRLRWYDADFTEASAFFEVKRRVGNVTRKARTPVELSAPLDQIGYHDLVRELLGLLHPDTAAMLATRCIPTSLVSYRREYFRDPDSTTRVTLDYSIDGFSQLGLRAPTRVGRTALEGVAVVEVKVRLGEEADARRLLYPLVPRLSRCSKYVQCCLADGMGGGLTEHI